MVAGYGLHGHCPYMGENDSGNGRGSLYVHATIDGKILSYLYHTLTDRDFPGDGVSSFLICGQPPGRRRQLDS